MKSKSISQKLMGLFGTGGRNAAEQQLKELDAEKRDNEDGLLILKDEIANLETRLLSQKKEFDRTHGERKLIVQQELTLTTAELTGKRKRRDVLVGNILRISKQIEALLEHRATQHDGLTEDDIDTLAVDRSEANERRRKLDHATIDLEKETYRPPVVMEPPVIADARDGDVELPSEVLEALETCSPRTPTTLTSEDK